MSGVASTKPAPTLAALDMDVALLGAFDGDFVVEAVDGDNEWFDLEVGTRLPVEQTYCKRMTQGDLPHLIRDTAADERTADLPLTRESGIGGTCYLDGMTRVCHRYDARHAVC